MHIETKLDDKCMAVLQFCENVTLYLWPDFSETDKRKGHLNRAAAVLLSWLIPGRDVSDVYKTQNQATE